MSSCYVGVAGEEFLLCRGVGEEFLLCRWGKAWGALPTDIMTTEIGKKKLVLTRWWLIKNYIFKATVSKCENIF